MAVSISGNSVISGRSQVGQAFLLDDYRDAAAAYSLRKLRYAYQGPAVRVRRSSDNTEQDIGFDAFGNLDEASLLTFTGANSAFVTKWYDQSTGSQQNLLQRSEEFDNASWLKYKSSISANSTATADPIGTNLSDRLIEDNTTDSHFVGWTTSYTISTSTTYTFSVYAKSNGRNLVVNVPLYVSGTITGAAYYLFDLTLGVFISCGIHSTYNIFTNNGASIVNVGNGWYRCSAFFTTSATQNNFAPYFMLANSNSATYTSAPNYAGDGSSGIYLWGAQLNTGSSPRTYTPTTSSTIDALRDASQSTAANQPRIVNAGVVEKTNGKSTIYFNSQKLDASSALITLTHSIFIAYRNGGTSAAGVLGQWASAQTGRFVIVTNQNCGGIDTQNNINFFNSTTTDGACIIVGFMNSTTVSSTSLNLIESICTTGTNGWKVYKNSTLVDDGTVTSVYNGVNTSIGAFGSTSGGSLIGYQSEIIIYQSDKSINRTGIESNINQYYSIY